MCERGRVGETTRLYTDGEFVQARVFVRGRYCLVTISPSDTSHKDAGFSTRTRPKGAVAAAIPLESLYAERSSWTIVPRRAGDDECGAVVVCALPQGDKCKFGYRLNKVAVTSLPLRASRAQGSKGSTSGGSNSEPCERCERERSLPWRVFRAEPLNDFLGGLGGDIPR